MNRKWIVFLLPLCLGGTPVTLTAQPDAQEQEHAARMRQANAELNALSSDLAKALGHPGFRGLIRAEIAKANTREHIVKLDAVLGKAGHGPNAPPGLQHLKDASRQAGGHFQATGGEVMQGLDLYFPVPEHRDRWKGSIDFLVAFAPAHGRDAKFSEFIAYSVKTGERVSLDPNRPPEIPVLVIAPEEHESHALPEHPAPVVKLPKRAPDSGTANAPENPVTQEQGNSYVGAKYLNILETKEWWWEGDPEIYLLFGQRKGNNCDAHTLWLSEVNRTDTWYNLWSRATPARWYFDTSYYLKLRIIPMERDAGGYSKLMLSELYSGITCEWTINSTDDAFPIYTQYRSNFDYDRDYYQFDNLLSQYWLGWRKEH